MRSKRARHQPAQAKFVKRSYRGQVVLPELVVNHTQSRHYYAWPVVAYLHNREPKIHMLVVPACNEFVRAEKKDWPGSDLLADDVAVSLFHVQYFQGSGNLQASETCDLVASNQHQLHPAGPVRENSEEDVNDVKVRAAQGRAIGVTKISAFDQILAQCAMAGHIAFDNTHGRPPGHGLLLVFRIRCTALSTVARVPFHAGQKGAVSGRQRRQGRTPAVSAAAAEGK